MSEPTNFLRGATGLPNASTGFERNGWPHWPTLRTSQRGSNHSASPVAVVRADRLLSPCHWNVLYPVLIGWHCCTLGYWFEPQPLASPVQCATGLPTTSPGFERNCLFACLLSGPARAATGCARGERVKSGVAAGSARSTRNATSRPGLSSVTPVEKPRASV